MDVFDRFTFCTLICFHAKNQLKMFVIILGLAFAIRSVPQKTKKSDFDQSFS